MPTGRPMRVRNFVASVNSATSTSALLLAFVRSCESGGCPREPRFREPVTSIRGRIAAVRGLLALRTNRPLLHGLLITSSHPFHLHHRVCTGGAPLPPRAPLAEHNINTTVSTSAPAALTAPGVRLFRPHATFIKHRSKSKPLCRGFRGYRTSGRRNTSVFPQHPQRRSNLGMQRTRCARR